MSLASSAAPGLGRLQQLLRLALLSFGLALLSLWISRMPGSVAGYWLPNALAVVLIARQPLREWGWLLATALLSASAAGLAYGDSPMMLWRFLLANGVEVLVGASLLRRYAPLHEVFDLSTATWWKVSCLGVLLPGAVGAAVAIVLVAPALKLDALSMAALWFTSTTVGGLSLLALLLLPKLPPAQRGFSDGFRHALSELGSWAVGLPAGLLIWAVLQTPYPFVAAGALALSVAVLLPSRLALRAIFAMSCTMAWGVSAGLTSFAQLPNHWSTAYMTHLLAVLPAVWVTLERRGWASAREAAETIIDVSPNGVVVLSAEGRVIRCNEQAALILGCVGSDLLGRPWALHDLGVPVALDKDSQSHAVMRSPYRDARLRRLDGSVLEADLSASRFFNADRELQTLITFRDVSARRREERALQEALNRLERFAEVTPGVLAIFRLAPDGRMSLPWQSPKAAELWELPSVLLAEDATPLFEQMSADTAESMRAAILESAANLTLFRHEFEYGRDVGRKKWLAIESMPVREPDGAVAWFGFCIDVTGRRNELAARHEQDSRWALAAEAGGVGIWEWDRSTGSVRANDRWFDMLGLARSAHPLSRQDFDRLFHPDDALAALDPVHWAEKLDGATWPAQTLRMHHPERGWIWVEVRCRLASRSDLTFAAEVVSGTMIDVSDRVEAEQLKAAHSSAEAASLAKTLFVSRMSHELRTPLNAVLGFAELLEEDPGHTLTDTQHQNVKQVIHAAESLLSLINDVLDLSQLEASAASLQLAPTPLASVLDEVITAMMPMARREQVQLHLDPPRMDWLVLADRRRLSQVLLNFLSNGIKYNHPGGTVRLYVERHDSTEDGARLRIAIADTGRGISSDGLQHLGEAFNRLGAERSGIAGTGIGVTISKSLLASMNGSLEVKSTLGRGSTFTVVLPLVEQVVK